MQKGTNCTVMRLGASITAMCIVALFVVQIVSSLGHDEQSHPDALEHACDYCMVVQNLADADNTLLVIKTELYSAFNQSLSPEESLTQPNWFQAHLSRAPPITS